MHGAGNYGDKYGIYDIYDCGLYDVGIYNGDKYGIYDVDDVVCVYIIFCDVFCCGFESEKRVQRSFQAQSKVFLCVCCFLACFFSLFFFFLVLSFFV